MINYMEILGAKFPGVQASVVGDPGIYENIVLEEGSDPLPSKEALKNAALDDARTTIWRYIQGQRDSRRIAGVPVAGNWYHSDDPSRIQQIALVMMGANMPSNIMWKTMQGTFVQMTPQLASSIFQSIIAQDTKIFAHAEYHRQKMITSTEEPYTYDYMVGWPETYAEWAIKQTPPAPPPAPTPDNPEYLR
jgi:hypothetical protein